MTMEDFMGSRLLTWMLKNSDGDVVLRGSGSMVHPWDCTWIYMGRQHTGFGVNVASAAIEALNSAGVFALAVSEIQS